MQMLIIGFSSSTKILSKIIQFFTRSKISHTYIKKTYPEYNNESLVFQASGLSVNYENYRHFLANHTIIAEFKIPVSDESLEKGILFELEQLGKPYSVKQLFGYLFILFMRFFGIRVSNPFKTGERSYVCSELIAEYIGISNPEDLTPEDLYELIKKKYVNG